MSFFNIDYYEIWDQGYFNASFLASHSISAFDKVPCDITGSSQGLIVLQLP